MAPQPVDPITRGPLRDPRMPAPQVFRYAPASSIGHVVRQFWMPVWNFRDGEASHQRVLQYPGTLLVISPVYAIAKGPQLSLSHQELRGSSWGFGVLFQAAAGYRLHGAGLPSLVDDERPLETVEALVNTPEFIRDIRVSMSAEPSSPAVHARCIERAMMALASMCGPPTEEDELINTVTDLVEATPSLTRVDQLATRVGLDERALQRLTHKRLGLGPKWLIQRRRLQEASVRLGAGGCTVGQVAADLGYADQAHFTRDFSRVIGMTPGGYLRLNDRPRVERPGA